MTEKKYQAPLPPNTLRNADGTPYSAGHDEAMKDAKLREAVMLAIGKVSTCYSSVNGIAHVTFNKERAQQIGDELLQHIKEMLSQ